MKNVKRKSTTTEISINNTLFSEISNHCGLDFLPCPFADECNFTIQHSIPKGCQLEKAFHFFQFLSGANFTTQSSEQTKIQTLPERKSS